MRGHKPSEALDEIYGEGQWLTTPPPPCRHVVGHRTIKVKASKNRKAHTRQQPIFDPKKKCFCQLPSGALAAKSPDLNIAENFFNEITTQLAIRGITLGWPKNVEELQMRIEDIIEKIPKSWYRKAFDSLPNRWRKCIKTFGKMTDFYIPKHT